MSGPERVAPDSAAKLCLEPLGITKMANVDINDLVVRFTEKLDEQISQTPLQVLVLGPRMDAEEHGSVLRKHLYQRAKGFGAVVTGELRDLIRASKKAKGAGYNLCDYELDLANTVDAIVLIPASPGSFAEFGLFATTDEICEKSIVLCDKEFSRDNSFVNKGTKRAYKQNNAEVHNINYLDLAGAWKLVKQFLEVRRSRKIARKRRIGTAAT